LAIIAKHHNSVPENCTKTAKKEVCKVGWHGKISDYVGRYVVFVDAAKIKRSRRRLSRARKLQILSREARGLYDGSVMIKLLEICRLLRTKMSKRCYQLALQQAMRYKTY
jgi:hypothetical protein